MKQEANSSYRETEPMPYGYEPNTAALSLPVRLRALLYILLVSALLCALCSFNAAEASWKILNPAAEQGVLPPCSNLLGKFGLYSAGLFFWLLGAGAYYFCFLVLLSSICSLIQPLGRRRMQVLAGSIMLICGCSILAIQPWLLQKPTSGCTLAGAGGKLGYLDGNCLAEALMGTHIALALLIFLHGVALIYFGRYFMGEFFHAVADDLRNCLQRFRAYRERRAEKKAVQAQAWQVYNGGIPAAAATDAASSRPETPQLMSEDALAPAPDARRSALRPMTDQQEAPRRNRPSHETEPRRQAAPAPSQSSPLAERERRLAEQRARQKEERARREEEEQRLREQEAEKEENALAFAYPASRNEAETKRPSAPKPSPNDRGKLYRRTQERENILDLMPEVERDVELGYDPLPQGPAEEDLPLQKGLNRNLRGATIAAIKAAARRPAAEEEVSRPTIPTPEPPRPATPRPAAAPAAARTAASAPRAAAKPLPEDTRLSLPDYPLPPYDLLEYRPIPPEMTEAAQAEMREMQQIIIDTLATFKIAVTAGDVTRGPSITRYEFFPPRGLRVNRIANLNSDLMLATSSKSVNILAPIPGKNTVGIELENEQKAPVYLRELLQDPAFSNPKLRIPVALGKDVYGNAVIGDLAAMPHTLVAGTTGSGKSVCINSMILSMLYKFRPEELRLILVDPKVVEMQPYKKLPHLACPVVTNPARVIGALRWAVNEMEHRYSLFSRCGVRNFEDFNARKDDGELEEEEDYEDEPIDYAAIDAMASEIERQGEEEVPLGEEEEGEEFDFSENESIPAKLPYIVIFIDELADLMMVVKEDMENYIARLTQKARAAGIHLVVATQTPRANVVTGIIKANIPSRIALKVSSPLDSRIILDVTGAENLLGKGDFLFLPPGGISKLTRAQGAFVSDAEIASIIKFCASHARQKFDQSVTAEMNNSEGGGATGSPDGGTLSSARGGNADEDELYTRCVNLVVTERKASTSLLQRRFSIGYGRAAKIMDLMQERGVISPPIGSTNKREVLVESPDGES